MTTRRATDETTPTEKESEIGAVIRSWAMPREALEAVPTPEDVPRGQFFVRTTTPG
jgi:hypothetical protein